MFQICCDDCHLFDNLETHITAIQQQKGYQRMEYDLTQVMECTAGTEVVVEF